MGLIFSREAKKQQRRDCDDCRQGKEARLRKMRARAGRTGGGAAFPRVLREGPVRQLPS